ncbi:MAG: polysaccharide biosynthesis/export family protein [Planctomycetota bacterium]|jgi:protein involved in polysaccharide export with SLBB domain
MKGITTEVRGKGPSALGIALLALCPGLFCGCGNKFFDPTQVGRFRPVPAVNVILDSLGVAEETPVAWEGAEEPLPVDTVASVADYALRPGDTVTIQIFELLQVGVPHINNYLITETGNISVPEVGSVQAAGLTETQLEEHIKKRLAPNILKQPSVTATLVNSQQRAFSILGDGVRFPNRYPIPRYDFRLMDAIATAGGSSQFNVSYIYVSRSVGGPGVEPGVIDPGFGELELEVIEPRTSAPQLQKGKNFAPRAQYQWPKSKVVVASSEMINSADSVSPPSSWQFEAATGNWVYASGNSTFAGSAPVREEEDEPVSVDDLLRSLDQRNESSATRRAPGRFENRIDDRRKLQDALTSPPEPTVTTPTDRTPIQNDVGDVDWVFRDGKWVAVPREVPKPVEEEPTGHIEWVFRNGKWVPIQVGRPEPTEPVITVEPDRPPVRPGEQMPVVPTERVEAGTRLIRIPADKLFAGDPRYNVVIKPGDSVVVPVDIVGECSIMGNVNRAGFINITGRPITLKQAIAAAGGLGPLAWPKRCEIVRRIGREKEEIVMLDLDKIASGEQPDVFIKPHDLINVGTHATARWRAVLRNAFRATYGFGFVYDRNFANKDFFGQTFNPITPWKWDKVF